MDPIYIHTHTHTHTSVTFLKYKFNNKLLSGIILLKIIREILHMFYVLLACMHANFYINQMLFTI